MRNMAAAVAGGVLGMLTTSAASAADIAVMASNAVKEAYVELIPGFERSSGHKVRTTWAGTVDIVRRIGGGEAVDIVIASAPTIEDLSKKGRIAAGSRTDIVKSGIGVAIRAGAPRFDISSGDAVRKAVLAATSVAYSSGPSGVYLQGLFDRWGIAAAIKPRLTVTGPGEPVGEVVAKGLAEIGFQQISELLPVKGIEMLGPLPPDVQEITVFAAGLHANSSAAGPAAALVQFLTGPEASGVYVAKGLQPGR